MTDYTVFTRPDNETRAQAIQKIPLELRYTDEKHGIELYEKVHSSPTVTIRQITQDLLEFLSLDDTPPEEVHLTKFIRNDQYCHLNIKDTQITLRELDITAGSTLYFERTPTAPLLKPCYLTIVGPDEVKTIDYEWYRTKTTLGMLLEYVIEKFSLESVERERIHLTTINNELDAGSYSDERLSSFNLHNEMSVYVQIIPPLSPTTITEDEDVHVQCTYRNARFILDVPDTETIGELKIKIEQCFKNRRIRNFKLRNNINDEFNVTNSDQILQSFGIKPGETIFARFRLVKGKAQLSVMNKASKTSTEASVSLNTKGKHKKITVICTVPSQNPITFQISVTNTVNQLMKEIKSLTHSHRLVISKMYSKNSDIHFNNDKSRCLADFIFPQNDVINVIMLDKAPLHLSTKAEQKPMGLDSLGSSGYMNSVFQCLAHVPQLTNMFLEGIRHARMDDAEHTDNDWNPFDQVGDVTGAFAELLWHLWRCDEGNDSDDSFKPNRIKEKIGSKDVRFATDDQQDAQEFMAFFLDVIHEELIAKNQNQRNTIIKQLFFGEITSIITCTECNEEESTTHPTSFLSIPLSQQKRKFYINFISKNGKDDLLSVNVPVSGRVEHVVDEFAGSSKQPFLFYYILVMISDGELDFKTSLSEIPTDELIFIEQEKSLNNTRPEHLKLPMKKLTLVDCLKDFFSPKELEDGWTCQHGKCKKKTSATKQLKLSKPPPILIIQFKRFSHENGLHQKVETFVEYPIDRLNLHKCLPSIREEAIYDLIAVSNHMGSISGGHYIAYARHRISNKNDWYKFNDSCVTLVKPDDYDYDIVSRNAYLLFYIKRDYSNLKPVV